MNAHCKRDGAPRQMYIDCTPGVPAPYRSEVMRRTVNYCTCDWLLFGTDAMVTSDVKRFKRHPRQEEAILDGELGLPEAKREKFFSGNLLKFVDGE